jgi:hypothetical protein
VCGGRDREKEGGEMRERENLGNQVDRKREK